MIDTLFKAVLGITMVVCGWLSVQLAWRRVSAKSCDGLEGPLDCGLCHHGCRSNRDETTATQDAPPGSHPIHQESE